MLKAGSSVIRKTSRHSPARVPSRRAAGRFALALIIIIFAILAAGGFLGQALSLGAQFLDPVNLLAMQLPAVRGTQIEFAYEPGIDDDHIENPLQGSTRDTIIIDPLVADTEIPQEIKMELLRTSESEDLELSGTEPRVLIYHTHTTEAYTPTKANPYEESSKWRTKNNEKNIVRVGEELARCLRGYGLSVIHDTTNHEPPKLGTSYDRSLSTMLKYKEQYPSLTMFIDVHRDSYSTNGKENTDFAVIDGKQVARIMFVVGTGEGKTGSGGFAQKPDFKATYQLALRITNELNAINPKLARPIRVKSSRYNQHVSNQCLLAEIGHNANTLEEALNAVPYLAKSIARAAGKNVD